MYDILIFRIANHLYRNVCMRHWIEKQPDGQGLAADFDEYFKRLSEHDKEVCYVPTDSDKGLSDILVISLSRKKCAPYNA
jgi:hypothetical protein